MILQFVGFLCFFVCLLFTFALVGEMIAERTRDDFDRWVHDPYEDDEDDD